MGSIDNSLHTTSNNFTDEVFIKYWDDDISEVAYPAFNAFKNVLIKEVSSIKAALIHLHIKLAGIGDVVVNSAVKAAKATKPFWGESQTLDPKEISTYFEKLAVFGKVTSAMVGPIAIYQFVKAWEKILKNTELTDKIDGFIEMILSVNGGIKSAIASSELLEMCGKIGKDSLEWIFAATVLRCALSTASLVYGVKGMHESQNLLKEIEEMEAKLGKRNYETLIKSLLERQGIAKHIPEINEITVAKINTIFDNVANNANTDALEDVYKTLKGRVHTKVTNHKIALVADSVNLIATGMLILAPATLSVANVLMVATGVIVLGKYIYSEKKSQDLEGRLHRYSLPPAVKPSTGDYDYE